MDWTQCIDVESKPGLVAGRPVIKGTRVSPDIILEHLDAGYSLHDIVIDLFPSVPLARAEGVVRYAREHQTASA